MRSALLLLILFAYLSCLHCKQERREKSTLMSTLTLMNSEITFSLQDPKMELVVLELCERHKIQYYQCLIVLLEVLHRQKKYNPNCILQLHESYRNFERIFLEIHPSNQNVAPCFVFIDMPVATLSNKFMEKNIEPQIIETIVSIVMNNFLYRITPVMNQQRRIAFIHSCSLDYQYHEILQYLLDSIIKHKLIDSLDFVFVLNYGNIIPDLWQQTYRSQYSHIYFVQVAEDITFNEVPTLRIMHRVNELLIGSVFEMHQILYLHTKGVSYIQPAKAITDWVDLMLYFLVEKHMGNYHLLASGEFDVIGALYYPVTDENYSGLPADGVFREKFGGNFWWVSSTYFSKIPLLQYDESKTTNKYNAEDWLLNASYHIPEYYKREYNRCGITHGDYKHSNSSTSDLSCNEKGTVFNENLYGDDVLLTPIPRLYCYLCLTLKEHTYDMISKDEYKLIA